MSRSGFTLNPQFERKVVQAVSATVEFGAHQYRNALIETAANATPGQGRIYKRGSVEHHASAPGDPWATDTGRTIGSINVARISPLVSMVGSNVKWWKDLEFGTERVAARPTIRQTMARDRARIQAEMLQFLRGRLALR